MTSIVRTNQPGGALCSMQTEMSAFDALPRECRDALNYAPQKCSALDFHKLFRRGVRPREALRLFENFCRTGTRAKV